jgi:agmatinase
MPGSPSPSFIDATTFLRCPRVSLEDVASDMVVVIGLPHDSTAATRTGARYGPAAIRQASAGFDYLLNTTRGREVVDVEQRSVVSYRDPSPLVDLGDLTVYPLDPMRTVETVAPVIARIVARGAFPVVLGGDHFISLPAATGFVRGVQEGHEDTRVGYIHVDGDLDISDENPTWGRHFHGTNARRIAEFDAVSAENMVMIGISGSARIDQWEYVRDSGITMFTLADIRREGVDEIVRRAIEIACQGVDATYLTCDIDVLDGAYAPGTGAVKLQGLTPPELLAIGEKLSEAAIGAADVVEVAPNWDPTGRTPAIAADYLTALLGKRLFSTRFAS